ncbi:MAG: right-handed parallel beta-helix repeat-containing protein [Clostridia bacterium]|nr:right-handed parallel beta-helix repeat-containing protein [Clostridia bacterium]
MIFNVKDYGAVGDGRTLNTKAIQAAIDACATSGGGRVLLENGVFMSGTLILRSFVELHLAANATLLGSPNCEDYPVRNDTKHVKNEELPRVRNNCFIYAEESEGLSITGMGVIDCNGESFIVPRPEEEPIGWRFKRIHAPTPARVVFFAGCRNVKIEDVTMVNQPAGWSYWIHDCDYVTMDKLKIVAEVEYPNNDGIHINSSRNVTISNCDITCGDDCLVVRANNRSLSEKKVCEKVCVTNCNLTSYSSGIRIGWMNDGVIRNCTFANLVMTDTTKGIEIGLPYFPMMKDKLWTADQGVEATLIENISFQNIIMDGIYSQPITVWIEGNAGTKVEAVRNLYFSGIHAKSGSNLLLEGRAQNHLENIRISDCTFEIVDRSCFGEKAERHGADTALSKQCTPCPRIIHCDRLSMNNVEFSVL